MSIIHVKSFWIDKYPVTNAEFKKFLDATHYRPQDDLNFLRDWQNGAYPGRVGTTNRSRGSPSRMRAPTPRGRESACLTNGSGNTLPKALMGASTPGEISGTLPRSPFRTRAAPCAARMPFRLIPKAPARSG